MDDDPVEHMRQRVAMARRLASSITDPDASNILRQMAAEGEADIVRLEAERAERRAAD